MRDLVVSSSTHLGISSGGVAVLVLGIVLVIAALLSFRLLPGFESIIEKVIFRGKQRPERQLRTVGGPIVLGVLGVICIVAGVVKLA